MKLCMLTNLIFQLFGNKFKGWEFKNQKSKVTSTIEKISMYFSLAVSEKHIYGIMASDKANNANVFIHFINQISQCRQTYF